MSNTTVGQVYQQVMKDVIESSRVDFEEGGVDESVLEELRQVRSHSCTTTVSQSFVLVFSSESLGAWYSFIAQDEVVVLRSCVVVATL